MRGRVILGLHTEQVAGITPARAGKSFSLNDTGADNKDHPRACGEELWRAKSAMPLTGSPPRVRGRAAELFRSPGAGRITPARAGKRIQALLQSSIARDHPRACGEERQMLAIYDALGGSPPRVRGRVTEGNQYELGYRITPARAGKSHQYENYDNIKVDHPRACGEESRRNSRHRARMWITPARAGKSAGGVCLHRHAGDHPRACGEEMWKKPITKQDSGSPPRVRGRAARVKSVPNKQRITPARAGKSSDSHPP